MILLRTFCLVTILFLAGREGVCQIVKPDCFPVVTQFSPVPSGKGWKGEEGPLSEEILRDTVDNIREHGFTGIEAPTHRPAEIEATLRANQREGFLFIINHEAKSPETTVQMADLPFPIGAITDLGSGQPLAFTREGQDKIKLDFSVPLGEVLLCLLTPNAESGNDASGESANSPFSLWQLPNQTSTQMISYARLP